MHANNLSVDFDISFDRCKQSQIAIQEIGWICETALVIFKKKMVLSVFFSDSDNDFELLAQLSDWDTDSNDDEGIGRRFSSRTTKRVNYMQSLDDADFTFRFRLYKSAVNSLLTQLMPFVRVTTTR